MKPLLLTDSAGHPLLVDGDRIVKASWNDGSGQPNCPTSIVLQEGIMAAVQESVEKVAEALKV